MSSRLLDQLTSFGRKVDPVIIQALSRSSNSTFRPALEYHFKVGGGNECALPGDAILCRGWWEAE